MNEIHLNKIAIPSAAVATHQLAWEVVSALMGGTATMRAAGQRFLPVEPSEEPIEWEARLARTTLDPYYKDGVTNTVSKVFAKELQFSNVPVALKLHLEDIDQQQRNSTQFAAEVFAEAVNYGVSYLLVDYPNPDEPFANRAQELAAGFRPYWARISPLNLLDVRSASFNGAERLSLFRYSEQIPELALDGVSEVLTTQIREYKQERLENGEAGAVTFTVYRKVNTNWTVYSTGELSLDAVPIACVYTNRTGFYLGRPPLMDLAELNIEHWRKRSDLNNIIHICNVPFMLATGFGGGMDPETGMPAKEIKISVRKLIQTKNDSADIKWIEHAGSTINTALDDLARLEARMERLSSSLVTGRSGTPTATATAINAAEANADLKQMALALQDAINTALFFTAGYLGLPSYGKCEVNTSFSVDFVSDTTFAQVLELFALGLIDREVVIAESKRRNILDLNVKIAAEPAKVPASSLDTQPAIKDEEETEEVEAN
jgi:hypothetical protein